MSQTLLSRLRPPLILAAFALVLASPPARAQSEEPAGPAGIVPPRPLELPEAELPPDTPPADLDVVLTLTIGTDGLVREVALTRGVGSPWDEAAIAAARRFRFTPALQGDTPIAVTVPFTYSYRKPARRGRSLPESYGRKEIEPAPGFVYAGEVVEKGTRTPQAGVPVVVRDARTGQLWEALTDDAGRFVVYGLPKGALTLDIFTGGFEPLDAPIRVSARTDTEALADPPRYFLQPSGLGAYRTIVREPRPPKSATVIDLTEDELTRVAGTFGDPTRVVASLPGVARSPFGLGYYIVRGAELDNTGYFIDGHPAVFLYHLLGGPGVIHPELVGGLSFYPGGYPAMYGRYASSVIAVETKDPPRDRWHLDLEVDVFKSGFVFSLPFDDQNGIVTLSLRRSYYDLLLPAFTDDIDLAYTDYQARVSYNFSPCVRGRFVALGAMDTVSTRDVETGDGAGTSSTDISLGFHRLNLAFDFDLAKNLTLTTSAAWEYDYFANRRVAVGDQPIDASTDGTATQLLTYLRWRPHKGYQVESGLDILYLDYEADLTIPAAPPLGDPRPPVFDPILISAMIGTPYLGFAPYVSADLEVADGLRLLPGLRLNLDTYRDRVVPTLDPKLAVRWRIDPTWTLKGMAAMAHQPPQVFQIGDPFGDPSIPPVQGLQGSLGFEWTPAPGWLVSVEGFVQVLDNLVRPSDQLADEDGNLGRTFFSPDMQGRAYGMELLVRKEFGDWIYGWLSYTLARAERLRPPKDWVLYELDQTHVLNLAWTVRLGDEWSLGARFQLASGNQYYPIIDARYDADKDEYVPIYAANPSRLPVYHRLDLRLDKTWRFEDWMFELYLDIQNVYNAQNPETPRYSYDYRKKTDGISLPILPTLGFRMVF